MHPSPAPSSHPTSAAWLPCPTSAASTTATSDERRRPSRSLFPPAAKIEAQYPLATVLPPAVLSTSAHGQLPAPTTRRSWAGSITGTIAVDSSAAIEFWPTTSAQASGCRTALHDPSFAPGVRDRMRKLGLVGAVLVAVGCGGGSSRPLGNGSGSGGGSPDGGDTASVSLNIAIAGKGSVTVEGLSINCSASCAQAVASGSAVHLDATPASGMVFSGWSGACTGTGGCDLTLTQDAAVTATFAPAPPSMVTLAVQVVGSGSGRIVSSPTGIDCPGTCAMEIASGTPVTLNSAANPGS